MLTYNFYQSLKHDFAAIRDFYATVPADCDLPTDAVNHLIFAKRQIEKKGKGGEVRTLLYCIETLKELISEGNADIIHDFAEISAVAVEVYLGQCKGKVFRQLRKNFCETYGHSYWAKGIYAQPKFNRRAPENWKQFFSSDSDEDFKRQHSKRYNLLVACGMTALLLPILLCVLHLTFIYPAEQNAWVILVLLGSFTAGVGLFNIVAAFVHQYLGHRVTAVCLLVGTAFAAFGMFQMYH